MRKKRSDALSPEEKKAHMIGKAKDSPALLQAAIEYLTKRRSE